jgi:hypothetical protein
MVRNPFIADLKALKLIIGQEFVIGENFGVEQFHASSMGSVTSNIYACRF